MTDFVERSLVTHSSLSFLERCPTLKITIASVLQNKSSKKLKEIKLNNISDLTKNNAVDIGAGLLLLAENNRDGTVVDEWIQQFPFLEPICDAEFRQFFELLSSQASMLTRFDGEMIVPTNSKWSGSFSKRHSLKSLHLCGTWGVNEKDTTAPFGNNNSAQFEIGAERNLNIRDIQLISTALFHHHYVEEFNVEGNLLRSNALKVRLASKGDTYSPSMY